MTRIVLINPPHWQHSHRIHLPEAPPLGLLYVAAILRREHEVSIYDAEFYAHSPTSLALKLAKDPPDAVGLTSTVLSFSGMVDTISALRRHVPSTRIMVGGSMLTSLTEEEARRWIDFDLGVRGECEGNLLQIMNLVPEGGSLLVSGEPAASLNDVPLPARDLLDPPVTRYMGNHPLFGYPETQILWSRGCPHQCTFCSNPVFRRQNARLRDPSSIVEEMRELADMGIKGLFVYDDELIGLNPEQTSWLEQVCDEIVDARLSFTAKCQGRCNPSVFTSRTLRKMRSAGFRAIMWGVESGSPKVLATIRKGITPEQVKRTFGMSRSAGIKNFAFMMVGNMSETPDDINMSMSLLDSIKPDWVQFCCATPLRPTEFYEVNKHRIEDDDPHHVFFQFPICSTDTMSRADIQEWYLKLDRMYQKKLNVKSNLPRYIRETLTTRRGLSRFPYRLAKFLSMRREGQR